MLVSYIEGSGLTNDYRKLIMYNTKIKKFSDGSEKVTNYSYEIFKGHQNNSSSNSHKRNDKNVLRCKYKSIYRAKQNIIDLAYENAPWDYFVTLTFDRKKTNANIYEEVVEKYHKFIDNIKHQSPGLMAIFAPEFHSDKTNYHIHGLIKNLDSKLIKNKFINGKQIYDNRGRICYEFVNYNLGWSELTIPESQEAVSTYMEKYMTKDMIDLGFKKKYWRTYNLKVPKIQYAYWDETDLKWYIKNPNTKVKEIEKENSKLIYIKKD